MVLLNLLLLWPESKHLLLPASAANQLPPPAAPVCRSTQLWGDSMWRLWGTSSCRHGNVQLCVSAGQDNVVIEGQVTHL